MKKIGLIINPIAGLGGKAGYKGSDSIENVRKALARGYEKEAEKRAEVCLESSKIRDTDEKYLFFTGPGEMGENLLARLGVCFQVVGGPDEAQETGTEQDTRNCVRVFSEIPVDLILFCGGDGTARDVCAAIQKEIPVLGIPAGVKMYSGCFAVSPRAAGSLLRKYLESKSAMDVTVEPREVMDISESALGTHGNSPGLYGYLPTISEGMKLQGAKTVCTTSLQETEILAEHMVKRMKPDTLYLIGPGSTTFKIKEALGIDGTLLGVDVVKNRTLIQKDADEKTILALMEGETQTQIIVTCIGGNGFVFGRGNQQISAKVIRGAGKENIRLAVTKSKLAGLWQKPMLADTGDRRTDQYLTGYYRIEFHETESAVYRLEGYEEPNS